MAEIYEGQIKNALCPEGIWHLSDRMKNVLRRQINRLPNGEVPEEEAMYPSTASGMREFLEVFFTRHYFQVQDSLLYFFSSDDFDNIFDGGEIRILDIGCGPAVGTLAVIDVITYLLENQNGLEQLPVRFVYVLNDVSKICLAIGRRMLDEYFGICESHRISLGEHRILTLASDFPDNAKQLERIGKNYGAYHLAMFSYVIRPLADENGITSLANDVVRTEKLCDPHGRILILQDQYRKSLMHKLGSQIGVSVDRKELTQEISPNRGTTDTYTYSYYRCLYKPRLGERDTIYRLAQAVAGRAKSMVFEGI
jgi:hypothetical protein